MKKLFTIAILVGSFMAANAQTLRTRGKVSLAPNAWDGLKKKIANQQARTTNNLGTLYDTLFYFYNKHQYINTDNTQADHYFDAVYGTAVNSTTAQVITEFGCSYLNGTGTNATSAKVTISGAILLATVKANHIDDTVGIPIRLYLYNASAAGIPSTKIDSADGVVGDTLGFPTIIFFNQPRTVQGSFFMSYRAMPRRVVDTLIAFESPAFTSTSTATTYHKYGESLGYSRIQAGGTSPVSVMLSNTNLFTSTPAGLDLEPQVYPMVSFSVSADYTVAAPNATATPGAYCTSKPIGFSNLSTSPVIYNRQFNFNKFIPYWGATTGFSNSTVPDPADPIVQWDFMDNAVTTVTTTSAAHTTSVAGQLSTQLTISYRTNGSGILHGLPMRQDSSTKDYQSGTYNVVSCTTATTTTTTPTGINEVRGFEALSVYPNPTVNGKTIISGLNGTNTILVYDVLGQVVSTNEATEKETVSIDLSNKPSGSYLIKIINSTNASKVVRILHQN